MNTTSHRTNWMLRLFLFGPLTAFALALSVIGPARAEVFLDPMFDVNVTSNIVYGTGQVGYPDNLADMDLRLDLYQPTGAGLPGLLPGIVLIHGGRSINGDKSDMSGLATEFASRGYVATSIQYRLRGNLPPTAPYPPEPGQDQLQSNAVYAGFVDAVTGVNWLRDSAGDLNVDTDRIILGGFSAGADTSLFVGMANNNSESLVPKVEVAGILDMSGGLYGYEHFVDPADPATYIVHGRRDRYDKATDLAAALTAAGVPFGFPQIDGFHSFEPLLNTDLGNGYLVIDDMFRFFNDQLGLQAIPEPGDFDGDSDVDGADFLKWQRELGDATSLTDWQTNYGTAGSLASASFIPEPSCLLLVFLAITPFAVRPRK